jgi:hypothetical protein
VRNNRERFEKAIRARPNAAGSLVLARSAADDLDRITEVLRSPSWGADPSATCGVLARTNRELIPAAIAALSLGLPFRASDDLRLPVESPLVDQVLAAIAATPPAPLAVRAARARQALLSAGRHVDPADVAPADVAHAKVAHAEVAHAEVALDPAALAPSDEGLTLDDAASAVLGWAVGFADHEALASAVGIVRARLDELRRDDARLTLATAHSTKGLEFDHVAVIGMEEGRFPSARSVAEAEDPARALEEERRLAYVAWTRARRSLTLLYDPGAPSPFLLEAFDPDELGVVR